jgi:cytochrome c-type biogenesis protein CcmH/NrfG
MPPAETGNTKKVDELMLKRASEQFQKGVAALASRDLVSAIACLAEASRLDPSKARYHAYFGRALSGNAGARRQAENELNEAIRLEPSNLDYQVMLAEFYWNAGFPLRCQGEIKRVLEKNPFHPEARALRDKLSADTLKK